MRYFSMILLGIDHNNFATEENAPNHKEVRVAILHLKKKKKDTVHYRCPLSSLKPSICYQQKRTCGVSDPRLWPATILLMLCLSWKLNEELLSSTAVTIVAEVTIVSCNQIGLVQYAQILCAFIYGAQA